MAWIFKQQWKTCTKIIKYLLFLSDKIVFARIYKNSNFITYLNKKYWHTFCWFKTVFCVNYVYNNINNKHVFLSNDKKNDYEETYL